MIAKPADRRCGGIGDGRIAVGEGPPTAYGPTYPDRASFCSGETGKPPTEEATAKPILVSAQDTAECRSGKD